MKRFLFSLASWLSIIEGLGNLQNKSEEPGTREVFLQPRSRSEFFLIPDRLYRCLSIC